MSGGPLVVALLAAAVLLTGCDQAEPSAAACKIEVDTEELVTARTAAGIADCSPGDGDADLPDLTLPCLGSDTEVTLADIAGPAVINVWASWCGPCRKEMPEVQEFHETYGDQVTVLGLMWQDSYPAAALELAEKSGVTYPSLADPCGETGKTDLAITGAPVFLFVAADGTVTRENGGVDSVAEIVAMTERHLDTELVKGGRP